jgi:hypothetical protein
MTSNIYTAALFAIVDPKIVRCMRDALVYWCLITAPHFNFRAPIIRTFVIVTETKFK